MAARRPGLVTLGDSNTSLGFLPGGSADRWPERVGRQLGLPVLNLGRDGGTIRDAYDRGLVDKALGSTASFMTIAYAVDDCARISLSEFSGLLDRLLYTVETTVITPVLLTGVWLDPAQTAANRHDLLEPFNEAIRSAAGERGVRLVDVAARMEKESLKGNSDLRMGDNALADAHLNAAGSRLVSHLVVQALRSSGVSPLQAKRRRRSNSLVS